MTIHTFWLPLDEIQPSQLYINQSKLVCVLEQWQSSGKEALPPLPVKQLNGRVIFTDGHTRAFATYRQGESQVLVEWDEDALDWEAYQICVDWCLAEGIETIMDLEKRVVDNEAYQELWLDRCQAMQDRLEAQRQDKGIS